MANLTMTNWYIQDKTPYIVIGTAGENNAQTIYIQCDEIIENAEYFLDIGDIKNDVYNTQELTVKQQTTPTGEITNILYLKPMRSFLGKEGVKLLQVRCEYIDEHNEKVTQESNIVHATVNKNSGFVYKFDIAVFQQYLNKVKELAAKVAQSVSNITLGELKDTEITNPTSGQVIKYNAELQKWVNGEGGGSGGSSDYNDLSNKPKINNVVLAGNKTTSDLGINIPTKTSDLTNDSNFVVDAHYVHTDNNYNATAKNIVDGVTSALDGKVDKVSGKGLSTNDYTNADKAIVDGVTSALASKANVSDLARVATSGDYDDLTNKPSIPSVSVTQVLESGTKIAEIDIDGTTTNLYAPNGGSGSSTLSELTDVNLSSPTNEQVLTYDATSNKWINALAKKEIVQIAEEDTPESPNIEDKIYEVHGEDYEEDTTMNFPPSTATPKEIDDYFSDWGYRTWTSEDNGFRWTTSDKFHTTTFEYNNSIYKMLEIVYNFSVPNTYLVSAERVSDNFVSSINISAGTELNVHISEKVKYYLLGDSENQLYIEITDRDNFAREIYSRGIGDLQDVNITDPLQNNSVLAYDSATNRWKNSSAFATKSEVQTKQDIVQYSELPTPSASLVGKVLQYIGDGTPSKAVVTVIDDGGNKSSTTTGILSYLQNKNIPLNIGVNTYQIGYNNKYYSLAELQALEEQGSEIIMRGGTDSSFSTDSATVEAFTQDAEAVKTYAETNGFNTKLRIYPQGIRVYGGTDVDEKIGVLNDLGVEMAFNLECNVEMYDMSHSHPGYEEWYEYANGHDAGLGIANVAPFVTMPNGYSKGLMLNRAEMTHAKLTDTQRITDINTMIQAHRYVVLFGHSYQSEWTTAGEDGKTTTELFESFIDDLTETYGDEILWLTPTQAWNYFNNLPKTGHFYKCVAENNTYTWQEIPSVSEVTVTPMLSTGTKIGSISVDGSETDLFAPSGGSASDFDKFCDNIDIDYAFDSATNANYTIMRIYKDKLDGTKQYPFVYAPNGAEPCQKSTYEISHEDGWFLAINSGVFNTSSHTAIGMLIQDGAVLQNTPDTTDRNRPLTIDTNGNLAEVAYDADATALVNNGVVSAVCGFMAIVKNYEAVPSSEWNNIAHYTQNAQRQIIGQFGNGDYAIITCEGRNFDHSDGWTIAEAQQICLKHGLKFAYNLDGGGSTETMFGLKHINQIYEGTTGRKVPTFIVFNGTSTFTPPTPIDKKLSVISATKTKTQYDVGDTLNTNDIVVTAYYTDGTTANVTSYATISTSQVDMSTAGNYNINISYTEDNITKTTTIGISVAVVKSLTSISATKTVTTYEVGDTLSTNDITVMANYSDSTSTDVTNSATINTSSVDMSTAGTYAINISYTEDNVTKTTSIPIVVSEPSVKTLTSISATKTQTSYNVGDTLSTSDIVVTAQYSNSTSANVTSNAIIDTSQVDTSTEGSYSIDITYTEDGVTKSTFIGITVTTSGVLPAGYTELQFVYANGNQYVDTGINETQCTHGKYKVQVTSMPARNGNHILSAKNTYLPFLKAKTTSPYDTIWGQSLKGNGLTDNDVLVSWDIATDYEIEGYVDGKVSLDGVEQSWQLTAGSTSSASNNFYLFTYGGSPTNTTYRFHGYMYWCKMFDSNNNLLRHFIPCIDPNDVVGLYDLVTETFYHSDSDTELIAGDYVENEHTIVKNISLWNGSVSDDARELGWTLEKPYHLGLSPIQQYMYVHMLTDADFICMDIADNKLEEGRNIFIPAIGKYSIGNSSYSQSVAIPTSVTTGGYVSQYPQTQITDSIGRTWIKVALSGNGIDGNQKKAYVKTPRWQIYYCTEANLGQFEVERTW